MAGRISVPKGSMWRMGLSVRRPARLAVSSPKRRATAPCDTSWRMTDGTIAIRKSRVFLLRCIRNGGSAVFRRAVDAVARRRHGLETGLGDLVATALALPVGAAVELG